MQLGKDAKIGVTVVMSTPCHETDPQRTVAIATGSSPCLFDQSQIFKTTRHSFSEGRGWVCEGPRADATLEGQAKTWSAQPRPGAPAGNLIPGPLLWPMGRHGVDGGMLACLIL